MPGKVNPSVPEMVNQVCFQVFGCDATILAAADAGQLELNVMMPVIAWNAVHATRIMREAMGVLQERCVAGLRVDGERCRELLDRSTALATALSPYIGYAATADIAKTSVSTGKPIRELVRERRLLPDDQLDSILSAEAMTSPGVPGEGGTRSTIESSGTTDDQTRTADPRLSGQPAAAAGGKHTAARAAVRTKGPGSAGGSGSRRLAAAGPDHGPPAHRGRKRRR
jgi:hypothetical protein